jgi:hypothetical protein
MSMKARMAECAAMFVRGRDQRVFAAVLIALGFVAGWGISTTSVRVAVADEPDRTTLLLKQTKAAIVGSYEVSGTDADGHPYASNRTVDVSLAPSGALEISWDSGSTVGVSQLVNNTLVASYLVNGRTAISVMIINPDGSLSGNWLRRTDRGSKGTEIWKKKG